MDPVITLEKKMNNPFRSAAIKFEEDSGGYSGSVVSGVKFEQYPGGVTDFIEISKWVFEKLGIHTADNVVDAAFSVWKKQKDCYINKKSYDSIYYDFPSKLFVLTFFWSDGIVTFETDENEENLTNITNNFYAKEKISNSLRARSNKEIMHSHNISFSPEAIPVYSARDIEYIGVIHPIMKYPEKVVDHYVFSLFSGESTEYLTKEDIDSISEYINYLNKRNGGWPILEINNGSKQA